jgi:hypothetical protein
MLASRVAQPGANPTITSYNTSGVKIYNAANSIARFWNKNDCFILFNEALAWLQVDH